MSALRIIPQGRSGLLPEHQRMLILGGGIPVRTRMTVPARERLAACSTVIDGRYRYQRPPVGLLWVITWSEGLGETALRCDDEPPYPHETACDDMWLAGMLASDPDGWALVHYEAGYVPGYRVSAGPSHKHYRIEKA